jgi:integrase/recombinase XerD
MLARLTLQPQPASDRLQAAFDAFMLSREAMRCTPATMAHYLYTLRHFVASLQAQDVHDPAGITSHLIRSYLVDLQRRGLKDTTQHANARAIKTWCRWMVEEGDIADNPMRRVAMPRLELRIPPPFTPQDVFALLSGCDRRTAIGARNYALVLTLLDTGLRAAELRELRVGDIDMRSGLCVVMGKGRKQRQVRLGARARAAIVRMLAFRENAETGAPLWVAYDHGTESAQPLKQSGLQIALRRLGQDVGVVPCAPHRFRRTFALWCLRDGMDLHSLRLLMGHSTLDVLQRYLALAGEDIERAHKAHSPADRLLG